MSYKEGDEVHIEDDDAKAGETTGHVRWILGLSLLAAIAILSAIWIFGAFSFDSEASEETAQEAPADTDDPIADDAVVTPENDEVVG